MITGLPNRLRSVSGFALVSVLLAGCAGTARPLMPTPALYHQPPVEAVFEDVPPLRRRPRIDLFFVTDRAPEDDPEAGLPYGGNRARSLAFGNAVVEMAPALSWPELVRQSQLAERSTEVTLEMGTVEELGRFPAEPYAMERALDGLRRASAVMAAHQASTQGFQAALQRHLAQSRNGEVLLSPDIDTEVAREKLVAFSSDPDLISRWTDERLPRGIRGRLTIYASPTDRALLASKILFRSRYRLGELRPEDIGPASRDFFSKWGNIDLVVYEGKPTDFFGHSYFSSNPQVSSDLIQLIRYGRAPGEPGRPLEPRGAGTLEFPKQAPRSKGE